MSHKLFGYREKDVEAAAALAAKIVAFGKPFSAKARRYASVVI